MVPWEADKNANIPVLDKTIYKYSHTFTYTTYHLIFYILPLIYFYMLNIVSS